MKNYYMKSSICMSHMLTDDYKLPNLKSHVPSPLWPDVGLFYQCKRYLHHANIRIYKPHWPTMVREYSILKKIIFYFEGCEDNSNVNAIIFLKKFLIFLLNITEGSPI